MARAGERSGSIMLQTEPVQEPGCPHISRTFQDSFLADGVGELVAWQEAEHHERVDKGVDEVRRRGRERTRGFLTGDELSKMGACVELQRAQSCSPARKGGLHQSCLGPPERCLNASDCDAAHFSGAVLIRAEE